MGRPSDSITPVDDAIAVAAETVDDSTDRLLAIVFRGLTESSPTTR
ncbi:hypothetical protein [Mycobacterium asiaticum]|nr:hypothetical protein [Mycobacterium asiaticum]